MLANTASLPNKRRGVITLSEEFFFNPGDAIASDFDYNKAYIAAQIYHHKKSKPLLIVQERDGHPYFVFDEAQALAEEHEKSKSFTVIKHLK